MLDGVTFTCVELGSSSVEGNLEVSSGVAGGSVGALVEVVLELRTVLGILGDVSVTLVVGAGEGLCCLLVGGADGSVVVVVVVVELVVVEVVVTGEVGNLMADGRELVE